MGFWANTSSPSRVSVARRFFVVDIDRHDLRHLNDIRRAQSDAKSHMVIY
jgi:hypothetical protein